VRVLKLRRELNLSSKALYADSRCNVFGENLDDHRAIEARLGREEYAAHATSAELSLYGV